MIANLTGQTNIFMLIYMRNKGGILIALLILGVWGILGYFVFDFAKKENIDIISPLAKNLAKNITGTGVKKEDTVFKNDVVNVLLIGSDTSEGRRARGQGGFNTDTMILVSANPQTNKVLLTSVPRDLWVNGNKINALYTVYGEATLTDAFEQITGQHVDGVVMADFDDFRWIADSFGGVPINVQNTFTDYEFPNNTDSGAMPVTFVAGEEVMSGDRALAFSRSRKGNNGEGSDLMRAKRQHLVLQGMIKAISQPASIFWPMDVENFYNLVTAPAKIYTTLSLADVRYLWDFYKDRESYTIESFVVGDPYIYHPTEGYIAWVFVPTQPGFTNLHTDIEAKLNGTFVDPNAATPTPEAEQPQSAVVQPSQQL